jgi:hypothetical protein
MRRIVFHLLYYLRQRLEEGEGGSQPHVTMCVGCVGSGLTVRDPLSFPTLLSLAPKEKLTLSYSSKINGYLYHKRVSLPLKKMLSGGNAAHPVECDRPMLTIIVRQTANICRRLSHPTRSLSRKVCRGQERPRVRKGTLRPDF